MMKRCSTSAFRAPRRRALLALACVGGLTTMAPASVIVGFEDLPLEAGSFYNGADEAGGFSSGNAAFNNTFTDFGGGFTGWYGWSYSNMTDITTPGFANQYSAVAGGGAGGSSNYGVAFATSPGDATIALPPGASPLSMFVTNSTYAYFAMRDGTAFSKAFGGPGADDPDFFLLSITGLDEAGTPVGTVDFYLADYRFGNNSLDYIIDTWTEVDLRRLQGASTLSFGMTSSDMGDLGMNNPAYFAMDNLRLVPEPVTVVLLAVGGILLVGRSARRRGGSAA